MDESCISKADKVFGATPEHPTFVTSPDKSGRKIYPDPEVRPEYDDGKKEEPVEDIEGKKEQPEELNQVMV